MHDYQLLLLSGWVAMSFALSGCTSEPNWRMPGGTTQADFHQAAHVCQDEPDAAATAMTNSGQMETRNAHMNPSRAAQFDESKQQRFETCMRTRGYQKTD